MSCKLIFIIGAPRSGTTMLERILSGNPNIKGGPEPHIITPLAHLGVWRNVYRAPYDHIIAGIGQKDFICNLPNKEEDYWLACRSYCDILYNKFLEGTNSTYCLDKTPEYSTILPFINKVYPDAKYIVLTRHPAAIFSSFANSFFNGDYRLSHTHDRILERYIPAIAAFLRSSTIPHIHLRYEDLVTHPTQHIERIFQYLQLDFDSSSPVNFNLGKPTTGLGDPIGVKKHRQPNSESLNKWADELAESKEKRDIVLSILEKLDPKDLAACGYPAKDLLAPLDTAITNSTHKAAPRNFHFKLPSLYHIERKLITRSRSITQKSRLLRKIISNTRLACDVLLREY